MIPGFFFENNPGSLFHYSANPDPTPGSLANHRHQSRKMHPANAEDGHHGANPKERSTGRSHRRSLDRSTTNHKPGTAESQGRVFLKQQTSCWLNMSVYIYIYLYIYIHIYIYIIICGSTGIGKVPSLWETAHFLPSHLYIYIHTHIWGVPKMGVPQ